MRIYFIHVYRRHWEFYPEDEQEELFEEETDVARGSRLLRWLSKTSTRAWRAVHQAESGMLGSMRKIIDRLHSRVDPTEPMLHRVRRAQQLEVLYPSGISPNYARRRLRLLVLHKTAQHRRWIVINSLLIPITTFLGFLPGPNVFLAWNGYRLFSHVRAWRGGQRILNGQVEIVFIPSEELDELLAPEERLVKPLDHLSAATIGQRFGLPGLVEYLRRTGTSLTEE